MATTRPPVRDLLVRCGEVLDELVPILDAAGAPVTVGTGWSARGQVRAERGSPVLHEWTTAGPTPNAFMVLGAAGAVRLTATPGQTAGWQDWAVLDAQWDLFVTDPAGIPYCLLTGSVRLATRITR